MSDQLPNTKQTCNLVLMFDRKHIEQVLRINGVSATAADEEIRDVLLSAHYRNDEVKMAIVVLRENIMTKEAHIDGASNLLRSDRHLSAQEVSRLLGIDIRRPLPVTKRGVNSVSDMTIGHHIAVWLLGITIAIAGIVVSLYAEELGLLADAEKGSLHDKR